MEATIAGLDEAGCEPRALLAELAQSELADTRALEDVRVEDVHPHDMSRRAAAMFASVRADQDAFTRRIEAELKAIIRSVLGLAAQTPCFLTGSGSESILFGLLSAKRAATPTSHARRRVAGPLSLHQSFEKVATILDIELALTGVDADDRASPVLLAQAIDERTMAIAASAPNWRSGVCDPLAAIADVARTHRLHFHVDACIGGFLLPFLAAGAASPPFRIDGISSLAVDLHKFGYAPFSISVICFPMRPAGKDEEDMAHGAPAAHPTSAGLPSDRPFWPIAAAWAVARALGRDGYKRLAARLVERRTQIIAAAQQRGLTALADAHSPIVRLSAADLTLEELSLRLTRADVSHQLCRQPGHVRLRVDPLSDTPTFDALVRNVARLR